jgi:DNA-binding NarL/FixJ family response regulator
LQLLKYVARGLSSKEIAQKLGVTEKAIEASIKRVHEVLDLKPNLGASKRISLVRAFYELTGRTPPRD